MSANPTLRLDAATLGGINRAVGYIGLVVGLVILLGGGWFIHRNHLDQFLLKSSVAEGQVVENQRVDSYRHGSWSGSSYRAVVHFADHSGEIVKVQDWVSFKPPAFWVGQRVKIFYDPKNPQYAMIDRGPKNYLLLAIVCVFGGLMVLGGFQRLTKSRS